MQNGAGNYSHLKVGVLALQGGFERHLHALSLLNITGFKVRDAEEIQKCDALILPGGESTTMWLLIEQMKLEKSLFDFAHHHPVFATCAGMILLSKMGLLHIKLNRNAYGSQIHSFSTELRLALREEIVPFTGIFIRAPKICATLSEEVKVMAKHEGAPVLVRQKNLLAMSFHPELTESPLLHRYFIETVSGKTLLGR